MSGKYVFLVICCVMLSAHSYQLYKIVCEGSLCLYLYESVNPYVTWYTSRTACTDEGLEMLRIESSQTKTIVDRLLQDLPQSTSRHVWIGGRGSSDDTWRYMNGTEFHRTVSDNSASDLNCVHVKLCKDANPEYVADNCDEKKTTSRVLCQFDKSETGECRPSGYRFGDECYVNTPYDGSESNKIDWYGGQTYCSQSPVQGDIAYSYLDDNSSINNVRSLFDDGDGCAILWLGVRRRNWFWRTVSGSNGQPINYFNWFDGTQIQPSYDNCIYVYGDNANKWRTQSCYTYLHYFICMNETATSSSTTTITTTEATGPTSTTTKQTTTIGFSTTGSDSQQKGSATTKLTSAATNQNTATANPTTESKAFITTLLVCVVLLVIIIGLTVTLIRHRRRMLPQSFSVSRTRLNSNDVTHTELATRSLPLPDNKTQASDLREQDNQEEEYEQIGGQDGQGHNTQISEGQRVETDVNPYEKPNIYINMVDRPNTYEALKK